MSCSLNKTKKLAKDKGIINRFGNLVEDTGEKVTEFNRFVKYIKDLAISKYGSKAKELPSPMRLDGKKVKFNISFFNFVDNSNEGIAFKRNDIELNQDIIFYPAQFTTIAYDKNLKTWILKIDEDSAISNEKKFTKDGWNYTYADWLESDRQYSRWKIIDDNIKTEYLTKEKYELEKGEIDDNPFSPKVISFEEAKEYWNQYKKSQDFLKNIGYKKGITSKETNISKQVLETISNNLKDKLGVDYQIVTSEQAKELIDDPTYNGLDPFYHTDGKVYMVEDNFTLETPIHEFSHPFVRAIMKRNPKLFKTIVLDLLDTKEGQSIEEEVRALYPEDIEKDGSLSLKANEEVVVRALTQAAKGNINPETGKTFLATIKRLYLQFKLMLRDIFGKDVKVADLNENTTLQELADMLTVGKGKIDLNSQPTIKYGDYQTFRGMPFQESTLEKMSSGEQTVTIRPRNYDSGIYILNGEEYHIENLGLKNIQQFKNPEALKSDFKGDEYTEGKFEHIDAFFKGTQDLYVYQITKLNNKLKQQNISFKRSLDLVEDENTSGEFEGRKYDENTLNQVIDEIKDVLIKQKAIFKKSPNSKKFIEDTDKLLKALENTDNGLASVLQFIMDSNIYINQLYDRFQDLKTQLGRNEVLYPKERNDALKLINKISELNSSYNLLDEVKLTFNAIDSTPIGDDINLLNRTIDRRNRLTKDYEDVAKELITDWLYNEAADINKKLIEDGKEKYILSKDKIKAELTEASSDIGYFENMFGSAISSKDPITALAAKAIKLQMTRANEEDIDIFDDLVDSYEEAGNPSINDNQKYIQEVEIPVVDDKGNKTYQKAKGFITKYREDLYDKNKSEFFKKLGEKPADPKEAKEYDKQVANWFKQNQAIKSDAKTIIDNKRATLSADEFNRWFSENTNRIVNTTYKNGKSKYSYINKENPGSIAAHDNNYIYLFAGELTRPSDKYLNPKYKEVKDDKYYQKLLQYYNRANDQLPINRRLRYGILPQIVKDTREKSLSEITSRANIKDNLNVQAHDTHYSIQTLSGEDYKQVPIRHTIKIDEKLVSENLLESVLKFSQMSNNYKHLSDIKSNIDILMDLVRDRSVVMTNSKGEQIVDAVTKKLRLKSASEAKKVNERLKNFIDMAFYGQEEIKSSFNLAGTEFSTNKVAGKLQSFSSLSMMAGNVVSGITNSIWGNYQTLAQSIGGKNYTKGEWLAALGHYTANMPAYAADLGKRIGKSKDNQLAEIFDAIQGEYKDHYGNKVSGTLARRLFTSNALFFNQNATEHQIQLTSMIAILKHHKVKTTAGEEISLYDAYELKGNRYKLRPDVKFGERDKFNIMNEMHSINKRLHGVYNNFDKPEFQRQWYGKLMLMFRKHIYKGVTQRYGKQGLDVESGEVLEGYYRTYFNKLAEDIREYGISGVLNYKNYSEDQKIAFKKTMLDTLMVLSTTIIAAMIAGNADDDDRKKTWAENMLLLQMRRFSADINFYTPVGVFSGDIARIINTPTVTQRTTSNMVDFIEQLLTNPAEEYKRASGLHKKGDSKLKARFEKIVPFYRSILNTMTPEEQNKIFNKH